jgi:hypothetical protein
MISGFTPVRPLFSLQIPSLGYNRRLPPGIPRSVSLQRASTVDARLLTQFGDFTSRKLTQRNAVDLLICLSLSAALVACGGSSNSSMITSTPVVAISATGGSTQSTDINLPFNALLQAAVTTNGSPTPSVAVTFTAPANGPSGTFANNSATETDTTDGSGIATSSPFTADGTLGGYTVAASVSGAVASANFSLMNVVGGPATILTTSGALQNVPVNSTAAQLIATVEDFRAQPVGGVTVTFTAPSSGPSGTFATTPQSITATAITNASGEATAPTFTANDMTGTYTLSATVAGVDGPANFLLANAGTLLVLPDGNYVFSLSGTGTPSDAGTIPHPLYALAGVFTLANGLITGGEQDLTDYDGNPHAQISAFGSSISQNPDGNLLIILATGSEIEIFDGSFLPHNSSKAFITEFDDSFTASGTLELQSSTAAPSGGYAFELNGLDKPGGAAAIGGVLNINPIGTISATGSIVDAADLQSGPAPLQSLTASTVSAPDPLGRITFPLHTAPLEPLDEIALVGYIVDTNHIQLVETNDNYNGSLGGTALSQGTNTGQFSTTSVSGNSYVVGLTGFDHPTAPIPLQVAGLFTFNPDLSVSGFINYNDLTGTGVQSPVAITAGTYTVDNSASGAADAGTGRVTVTITAPVTLNLELYLDGIGHATAITLDSTDALGGLGFQQSGSGSFTAASFTGSYVMDATGWDRRTSAEELDAVGPITATGNAATFSGTADLNWLLSTNPGPTFQDAPVSGTFTSAANGVFTGTLTGLDVTNCPLFNATGTGCTPDVFTFYLIDSTGDSIAIETDTNQLTLGYFSQK